MQYNDIFDIFNNKLEKQDILYQLDIFFQKKIMLHFNSEQLFKIFYLKYDYIFQYMFESGYLYYIDNTINIKKLYQQINKTQIDSLIYAVNFPDFIIRKIFPTVTPVIFNFHTHEDTLNFIFDFYTKIQKTNLTIQTIKDIEIQHPYFLLYLFFTQKNMHTTYLKDVFPILQKQNKLFLYTHSRFQYNSEGLNFLNNHNALHYLSNFEPHYLKEPFYVEFFINSKIININKSLFIFEKLFINDIDFHTYEKVFNKLWLCLNPSFKEHDCINVFQSINESFDSKFIDYYIVIVLEMITFYESINKTTIYHFIYESYCMNNEFILVIQRLIHLNIDLLKHKHYYSEKFIEMISILKEIKDF